jgi:DNA mismatch repair protein MSH6
MVELLEDAEDRLKHSLNVFTSFLFNHFHQNYKVWDRFVEGLAQLDCLCSLSLTSFLSDGLMCRPEVHPPNDRVFLEVREMRHPCICLTKSNFVPNDIIIGDVEGNGSNKNIILLTGPNMGGKSTILR